MILCLVVFLLLLGFPGYVHFRGNVPREDATGLGMPRVLAEVGLFLGRMVERRRGKRTGTRNGARDGVRSGARDGVRDGGNTGTGVARKPVSVRDESGASTGPSYNPLFETEAERKRKTARIYGLSYLVALFGALLGLMVSLTGLLSGKITTISRPDFGESREIQMVVNGFEHPEEVTATVSGRDLSREETEKVFDAALEEVLLALKKDNTSLLRVTGNLQVPEYVREVIRVKFRSGEPELLSDYGIVFSEDIPEDGADVTGTVTLSYKAYEKSYKVPIKLFPKSVESSDLLRIEEALRDADAENPEEDEMLLPKEISGQAVSYEKKKVSPYALLFLFLIAAVLPVFMGREREKQALKNRDEELTLSYTKVLGKFSSLLDAGMSVRSVFLKLAEDYAAGRREGTVKKEYVFEEMVIFANRLKSGEPEMRVYPAFGRQLGQHRYMKFASLLEIHVKQGVSGLQDVLETEMQAALEERKNLVLKKGEEAGTKQLFPMLMMLGIVLIVLVVPVFMSL